MTYDYEFNVKDLFANANQMSEYIRTNPEGYRIFLKIAARCEHFTPSNQLLIYGFGRGMIPEYLDDYSNWINNGYVINDDAKIIHVMAKDNSVEIGYKDRMLVDVSDTNAVFNSVSYDKGIVLEALMTSSPCRIEYNPDITSKAIYIPKRNVIEVSRGFKNIEEIFENLSREMVHARLHMDMLQKNSNSQGNINMQYPRSKYSFLTYSVSYMLASKYNMSPEQIEIKALPEEWRNYSYLHRSDKSNDIEAIFKNDVLKKLNDAFKASDSVLSQRINDLYNQAGSEL